MVQLISNYPSNLSFFLGIFLNNIFFIIIMTFGWYSYKFDNLVATRSNLYLKHLMNVVINYVNILHELLNFTLFSFLHAM